MGLFVFFHKMDKIACDLSVSLPVFLNQGETMFKGKVFAVSRLAAMKAFALSLLATAVVGWAPVAPAQVSVNIGVAPVCPYGYFDYAPYDCAPYGYYGPDWFVGGVFLGAGPWFHGPRGFFGHVDNRYDPHHGYHGPIDRKSVV